MLPALPQRRPLTPEPSHTEHKTRGNARWAFTPPPTGSAFQNAAWETVFPEVQAARPKSLSKQLLLKLGQNTKLGKFLKTAFGKKSTSASWSELEKIDKEIQNHVLRWHQESFNTPHQSISSQHIEQQALAIKTQLLKNHPIAKQFPDLLTEKVQQAMQSPLPYQLFYQNNAVKNVPTTKVVGNAAFLGGYFKAQKKTQSPVLEATRVRTSSGQVYELLNQITPEIRKQLIKQHNMKAELGKLILGEGGAGKVRLARHLDSGNIVAVKKFTLKKSAPKVYAEKEVSQFEKIKEAQNRQTHASSHLLDTMLDFAHVFSKKQTRSDPKSYIFTPLANLGDGDSAAKRIHALYQTRKTAKADRMFLNLSKQYTAAVQELHALGLHHRDIKPKNFLHDRAAQGESIRLADFGVMTEKSRETMYIGGTDRYTPPEAMVRDAAPQYPYHAEKHDLFSLGLSLLELRLGRHASKLSNQNHLTLRYTNGSTQAIRLRFNEHGVCLGVPDHQLQNLDEAHVDNTIAQLLARNPNLRISAETAHRLLNKESA
jgi:hypothetical protein